MKNRCSQPQASHSEWILWMTILYLAISTVVRWCFVRLLGWVRFSTVQGETRRDRESRQFYAIHVQAKLRQTFDAYICCNEFDQMA